MVGALLIVAGPMRGDDAEQDSYGEMIAEPAPVTRYAENAGGPRSEEHTSELQSQR